jgi:hypothetical protein
MTWHHLEATPAKHSHSVEARAGASERRTQGKNDHVRELRTKNNPVFDKLAP